LVGVAVLAFCWGRSVLPPRATAAPPNNTQPPPPTAPEASGDYSQRVVAYINGTEQITREDLGEYLIARQGAERLELLVNKRIIDRACREHGVEVTEAEIQAVFAEDLQGMGNLQPGEFVNKILKQYHKTLYEWKEDVLRPKIALTKLCQKLDRIHVTDQDLQMAFDAYYGEKVECRMIMWPKAEKARILNDVYGKIRASEKEFEDTALHQASPQLAAQGGKLPPIGRHTTGDENLEKAVFALHEGDLSEVIESGEWVVVLKCLRRIPPDATKKLADVRETLHKEVLAKKTQVEIPRMFKELREKAEPKLFLKSYTYEEDFLREVRKDIKAAGEQGAHRAEQGPAGN
jgi:parvulin-like peptidyl-prolyl isomerase